MLSVTVKLHRHIIAVLHRITVTGLDTAADAQIDRKIDHVQPILAAALKRAIL